MVDKKKHQNINDAAAKETRWIEPIGVRLEDKKSSVKVDEKPKENHDKNEMRENKQRNRHTFRHEHDYRKTIPKNSV